MYKKAVIAVVALSTIFVIAPSKTPKNHNSVTNVSSASVSNVSVASDKISPQLVGEPAHPVLQAKSALAIDVNTGKQLYSQNAGEHLPIASLTKLVTAMVVLDHVSSEKIVTVDAADTKVECSCMELVSGEQITVENLLKGMLIPSGNDAAYALARYVGGDQDKFVAMMNEKAATLKLSDTHFSNPAGLVSTDNYSSANDLYRITQEFLKYALLERIVATAGVDVTSVDGKIVHHLKTSNKLLLTDSDVVGVKTGFTSDAQGNLIIKIDQNGIEVLTIVLNTPERESDTQNLIDWVFANYKW